MTTRWHLYFLGPRDDRNQRPYFGSIVDVQTRGVYFYLWWFALTFPAEIGFPKRKAAA